MSQEILIGNTTEFPLGKAIGTHADNVSIVVVHLTDGYYAIANKCPHLGLPLAGGKLEGNVITCPFHNSKFDVCTGKNLDWVGGIVGVRMPGWVRSIVALGKQPHGVTSYTVTEKEGKLYLHL